MGQINRLKVFQPGKKALSADVNAEFDNIIQAHNQLEQDFSTLKSVTPGASGSENIGSANISGVNGDTVHEQIQDVFNQLQGVTLGQIPNETITRDKLAKGAVDFTPLEKEIANLNLQLQASQRVSNGVTFGSTFDTTFGMTIDTFKANIQGASSIGAITLTLDSVTGLTVGKEITIYDDTNLERKTVTAINGNVITVSALTKAFKDKAQIARSMAVQDTVNKCLKFGGWSTSTTYTVNDATVVNQAYDTSGNGGRKLVRLSNGKQIAFVKDGLNIRRYQSTDNWTTSSTFNSYSSVATSLQDIALATNGDKVYVLVTQSNTTVTFYTHNSDGTQLQSNVVIDSSQTALGNCSLIINDTGTELHATWSSKNSTYANSFNIRYAKGTINADGSVTWGAVEQRTTYNTSGIDAKNPCLITRGSLVSIVYEKSESNFMYIFIQNHNGSSWGTPVIVYNGASYAQSSPSAIFVPQSVNGLANGRIIVGWHGYAAGYTTYYSAFYTFSDDGGVTWNSVIPIFYGSANNYKNLSISTNKTNEIFFAFEKDTNIEVWKKPPTTALTNILTVTSGTSPSLLYDLSLNFTSPLFIYKGTSKVGFCGTWTVGSETPLLENDVRFTVADTDEVVAWVNRDSGLTVNAQLNNETMTKTTVNNEDQFTHTLASVQSAEVKLTMTRALTTDNVKITKILGGVA